MPEDDIPSSPSFDMSPRMGINIHENANPSLLAPPDLGRLTPPVETATPPVQPEAPVQQETPSTEPPKTEEQKAPQSDRWQDILDSYTKDLKDGDPRLKNFGYHKDITSKVREANEAQALRILELEKQIEERGTAKPTIEGTLDPTAHEAQLLAIKQQHAEEVKEYREWKAKQDLTTNDSFRREFDGRRVELLDEARSVAAEVSLSEDKLAPVFDAKSELQLRKAVKELDLEDEDAERLILDKGLESLRLNQKKDALLSGKAGKSITELADEWKAYQADFGKSLGSKVNAELQGQLIKASEGVLSRLGTQSEFFKTPQGQIVQEELLARFRSGYDLDAEQVVDALAQARIAPIYEKLANKLAAERDAYKAQIDAMSKGTPGALGQAPGVPSGSAPRSLPAGVNDPFAVRTGINIHAHPTR